MTREDGVVLGVGRVVGGLFVDELTNGAVFFSLILIVGAVFTQDPPGIALGLCVGLVGMVLPWLGVHRKWPDPTMTLVAVGVLAADAATAWLIWQFV